MQTWSGLSELEKREVIGSRDRPIVGQTAAVSVAESHSINMTDQWMLGWACWALD